MEPVKIEDPKLSAKVGRILEQLKEYYPDGKIVRIAYDHKKLSERIGKVCKEIGYPSREAFYAAYGFEANKAGHPSTTDAEEVLAELRRRYDGKTLCSTTKELMEENPDLKSKIKTLQNNSVKDFGDGFKNILVNEGLLAVKKRATACEFTREEMDEALNDLERKVKESGNRPTTIAELKKTYSDYAKAIAFLPKVSDDWYGAAPSRVLHSRNILGHSYDAEKLVEWLKESYSSLPNDEKPASVNELIAANPGKRTELKEAQRTWKANHEEAFLKCLKKNGVIKAREVTLRKPPKESASFCMRSASRNEFVSYGTSKIEFVSCNANRNELVSLWKKVDGPKILTSRNTGRLALPDRVLALAINTRNKIEIRRSFFHVVVDKCELERHGVKIGMPLNCTASDPLLTFETLDGYQLINREVGERYRRASDPNPFDEYADYSEDAWRDSPVDSFVGAWTESISQELYGYALVCIRFDYPHKLTTQTMINLLYKNGVLTDADMLGGDDWRTREYASLTLADKPNA